jgi:hypothetical protein
MVVVDCVGKTRLAAHIYALAKRTVIERPFRLSNVQLVGTDSLNVNEFRLRPLGTPRLRGC